MINRISLITVLAFIGIFSYGQSAHALAVPECPCDTISTINGLTGNEILDMVCPGGELAAGADFIFNQQEVSVSMDNPEKGYSVVTSEGVLEAGTCRISDDGIGAIRRLLPGDSEFCRQSLIQRCDLKFVRPIPTLSEWGMIATAGVLGLVGLYAIRRRRAAA